MEKIVQKKVNKIYKMTAEIIRGVPFGKKKGGENGGKKREDLAGVLSVDFFYNNFNLAIRKSKDKKSAEKIFQTMIEKYLEVVNPESKVNKTRPKWAKESGKNLRIAIQKIKTEKI